MDNPVIEKGNYMILPRGGYLVDTPAGYIQFGSPPETIKDTMRMDKGVPQIFVLPDKMFNWIKGISVAEVEFPIYYNYFIKNKKTFIICNQEQFPQIQRVLQEALFGPQELDISLDYDNGTVSRHIPEIRNEMNYFRKGLKFSDLLAFGIFHDGHFTIQGIRIERCSDGHFCLTHEGREIAKVPGHVEYKPTYLIGERLPEPYNPPLFGVTCLGPSHGFDPEENTSGFIIWLNHNGIMVDPPVNSTEWLEDSNVNPKLIDSIILTHCHADHDAGTFQKILEEGKITIYTTETVMMSFLRKYSALSDVPESYLMQLFDFHPVKIGTPVFIHGGRFDMAYTLHSIPTVGFRMEFQDQSFVYTSDHNNDPTIHEDLYEKKLISRERYSELRSFPWDSKVIYHESGIAPLHTPIAILNAMPEEIKKNIVVYHIAKKDFPADTSLKLARFGIENTLYFETKAPRFEIAYQILGLLNHLDFFQGLPIRKAQEFLDIVEEERYSTGDLIIKKGSRGDKFFIIYSGNVSVDSGGLANRKIYGSYEYFGEVALVTEQDRAADVYAETDVVAYTIPREKFLNFIVGTEFEKALKRLARNRNSETWNLLSTSYYFQHCTASQKTWLESIFLPQEKTGSGILIMEDVNPEYIYIIQEGEVEVVLNGKVIAVLKRGDIVGDVQRLHKSEPQIYTFRHTNIVTLLAVKNGDMMLFLDKNPGLIMKLVYDFS